MRLSDEYLKYIKLEKIIILISIVYFSISLINTNYSKSIIDVIIIGLLTFIEINRFKYLEKSFKIILLVIIISPLLFLATGENREFIRFIMLSLLIWGYIMDILTYTLFDYPLIFVTIVILSILFSGTIGIYHFEDLTFQQSLWFSIVTATTVGYGDIVPKTSYGEIISVFMIIMGTLLFGAVLTTIVLNNLKDNRRRKKIIIDSLKEESKEKLSPKNIIKNKFNSFKKGEITVSELEEVILKVVEEKNDKSK